MYWVVPAQEDELPHFPRLSLAYLRDITLGVYQVKLAKSYIYDKRQRDTQFGFDMRMDEPGLLRARMYSRHSNAKQYNTWIAFKERWEEGEDTEVEEELEEEPILGYYCDCKSGSRTLGCCGHVASVLWYLGYVRHQANIPEPPSAALGIVMDAANRSVIRVNGAAAGSDDSP